MENLPAYIGITFALTTFLTVWLFYKATNHSKTTLVILLMWLSLQTFVSLTGFYTVTNILPPRFILLPMPAMLFIVGLFVTTKGRQFVDSLDLKSLTILHTIRIPVEIVLLWLFINKVAPQIMTFEGRNFDILSGIICSVYLLFRLRQKTIEPKNNSCLEFYLSGTTCKYCCNCRFISPISYATIWIRPAEHCSFIFSVCLAAMLCCAFGFTFTPCIDQAAFKKAND